MNKDDGLWTANDVARYLRTSRAWVYYHASFGTLPCHRVCGVLRFFPDEIAAFARGTPEEG